MLVSEKKIVLVPHYRPVFEPLEKRGINSGQQQLTPEGIKLPSPSLPSLHHNETTHGNFVTVTGLHKGEMNQMPNGK